MLKKIVEKWFIKRNKVHFSIKWKIVLIEKKENKEMLAEPMYLDTNDEFDGFFFFYNDEFDVDKQGKHKFFFAII